QELVSPAVNDFWNEVPTSKLRLKAAGFSTPIATADINTARLCSPTDVDCINDAGTKGQTVLPPVDGIVISCNNLADNFSDNSVVAVTVPNSFASKKIKGAVILINENASSPFRNLNTSDRIGVIAHEIGHAIGLGHSQKEEALMYYKVVDQRTHLGQDDIDGVTYLYPVKIDACGLMDTLIGATITTKGNDDDQNGSGSSFWQMGIGFGMMALLAQILKLLKRQQARPAF
ncbi:MAG: matrixin family metalloprotease, partial [Bacteriovoracaceae bacterium]